MFTWICPQCGREVPPAYTECPDCTARAASGAPPTPPADTAGSPLGPAAPPQAPLQPAPPPAYAPQPPSAPPMYQQPQPPPMYQQQQPQPPMYQQPPPMYQQPQPQAPGYYLPQPNQGLKLPTWLMAIFFALAFLGVGLGLYWLLGPRGQPKPAATVESAAAKPGAKVNPIQKFIEVTGVRFLGSSKGPIVRFVVINHSDSDIVGLAGNVTIWGRTQKSEEDAVGTFTFSVSLAAQESKELEMPLTTKLKMVELPDWQNVTTDVQITAPQGG